MPEISLPTKATQDSIKIQTDKIQSVKDDTSFIRAQFPISGGTNFHNALVKPMIKVVDVPAGRVLLDVSGRGFLHYLEVSSKNSSYNAYAVAEIDGVEVASFSGRGATKSIYSVGVIPFSRSLKIFVRSESATNGNFDILYSIY